MAAATAAALLSASGRRLSRSSASTIICREVSGRHKLTIVDGSTEAMPAATSTTFSVAGYSWSLKYQPYRGILGGDYVSLELAYCGWRQTDPVKFKFTLLDKAGEPVPGHRYSRRSPETCCFDGESRSSHGFRDFLSWKELLRLEALGSLKRNSFAVQCDITVIKDWTTKNNDGAAAADAVAPRVVVVPPSNLHEHLSGLLWKKEGTDVTIDLGGDVTLDAHGWLLASRSPVFEAELLAAAEEKASGRRRVEIRGIEPEVFKAMLHFMYTDALPAMEERHAVAMAQGLLAAAHRYELERLKLMCEEMLCDRIDVSTLAGILEVAERHGCRALKDACLEFMASPGNLKAVMESEGFEKMKANCTGALLEFVMKQLP